MGTILTSIKLPDADRTYLKEKTVPYIDCMKLGLLIMRRADDSGMQAIPWIEKQELRGQLCGRLLTFIGRKGLLDEWHKYNETGE